MKMSEQTKKAAFLLNLLALFTSVLAGEIERRDLIELAGHHPFSNLSSYSIFLDNIYEFLSSGENITSECNSHAKSLLDKARDGDAQALKILDSTGKPSSGTLEGGIYFIGFYSECVNSAVRFSRASFDGQYCLLNFKFLNDSQEELISHASWLIVSHSAKPPTIGICIPSSCSASDLKKAVYSSLQNYISQVSSNVVACHGKPDVLSKDAAAVSVLCIFLCFATIAISATAFDIYRDRKMLAEVSGIPENSKSLSQEFLCKTENPKSGKMSIALDLWLAFSLKQNAVKIFTVKSGGDNIQCVHGLKFLSMALIILGHTYSFATQNLYFRNPGSASQAPKDFVSQIFANGTLAVDTFYVISGLLVSFVTLKVLDKTAGKFPILYFYIHRYLRLTPVFVAVVVFCAYLLRYVGSGPNWPQSIEMYDAWCKENWWLNALYLHNFFNMDHMCLAHSWYLATDMQIYLIVPLILLPLHKNFYFGAASSLAFLLASVITTAVLTVVNNYPAIPYINNEMPLNIVNDYYQNVYIKPYCRIGPYIVGILLGYMLLKKKELIIKTKYVILLWLSSVAIGLTVIYLMWPANQGILPTASEAAAYSALARSFWAVSIAWLIAACYYGYGGIVNSILSCSILVPFSRLTYCAYLIHPVIMNAYYGTTQTMVDFSMGFMIYLFLGNICITFVFSTLFSLLFESPVVALEKIILSKKTK